MQTLGCFSGSKGSKRIDVFFVKLGLFRLVKDYGTIVVGLGWRDFDAVEIVLFHSKVWLVF